MSKAVAEEIQKALAFIEQGEKMLNTTMLKSRHAPATINTALTHIGRAKLHLNCAADSEEEAGDKYE